MRETVLVLGGVRSGKSRYAVSLARDIGAQLPVYFVATARADTADPDMAERIELHRATRPRKGWRTVEAPDDIAAAILEIEGNPERRGPPRPSAALILVDSLTVWLGNLLEQAGDPDQPGFSRRAREIYQSAAQSLRNAMSLSNSHLIFVSGEVGQGVAPATLLGNVFADLHGALNQDIAAVATQVYQVVAGIPVQIR